MTLVVALLAAGLPPRKLEAAHASPSSAVAGAIISGAKAVISLGRQVEKGVEVVVDAACNAVADAASGAGQAVGGGHEEGGSYGEGSGGEEGGGEGGEGGGNLRKAAVAGEIPAYASYRFGKSGWTAGFEFARPGGAAVHVYCLKGARVTTRKASAVIPAGAAGSATAVCPSGYKVLSGGFNSPGYDATGVASRVITHTSRRTATRSWTVTARNAGGASGTLVASANCGKGTGAVTQRSKSAAVSAGSTASPAFANAAASCRSGERLLAGGFETTGFDPTGAAGPLTSFTRSYRRGGPRSRTWSVRAANHGAAGTITAWAFCEGQTI